MHYENVIDADFSLNPLSTTWDILRTKGFLSFPNLPQFIFLPHYFLHYFLCCFFFPLSLTNPPLAISPVFHLFNCFFFPATFFNLFWFFSSFLQYFFPFPSLHLLFSPTLSLLRLITRWQIHCRLPLSPCTYLQQRKIKHWWCKYIKFWESVICIRIYACKVIILKWSN